jgi:hypothetical protein
LIQIASLAVRIANSDNVTMLRADVYLRSRAAYVLTQHVTETGIGLAGEPRIKLDHGYDAHELGAAVLTCMAGSREGMQMPSDWSLFRKDLLRFLNCSSWKALEREAFNAGAYGDSELVHLQPSRVHPQQGGFEPIAAELVTCPADAEMVGRILLDLRDKSKRGLLVTTRLHQEQPSPTPLVNEPLQVGDRVADPWGNEGAVVAVALPGDDPLGVVTVRYFDGRARQSAYIAHGYTKIQGRASSRRRT